MRFLFTITIFLGSALLFLIEPMVAKLILPKFGGAPAVWSAAMVFFQLALLIGYGYAHLAVKWLGPRRQSIIHAVLFLAALVFLPVVLPKGASVNGSPMPALTVIGALTLMVGLPFILVSAGAPLIQRWFAQTNDPLAHDPYFLYSASNVGSMLALLAYPLFIEPKFGLAEQSRFWMIGYGILGALLLACALALKQTAVQQPETEQEDEPAKTTDWKTRLGWIALAALPSSFLLGATTEITTSIAPIPLLWVLPLALYLLSFILAFARRKVPTHWIIWPALVLCGAATISISLATSDYAKIQAAVHLAALFFVAWGCHQTLAEGRPEAKRLTEFFFFIALGGVVGGIFNSLIAPFMFRSMVEYPIAICVACVLLPRPKPAKRFGVLDLIWPVVVVGILYLIFYLSSDPTETTELVKVLEYPVLIALVMIGRQWTLGLSLAAIFVIVRLAGIGNGKVDFDVTDRSFFGVHDVFGSGDTHRMVHGTTTHGAEDMRYPRIPTTYYTRSGPIGQVIAEKGQPSLAVVGLGAGTMACYGQPGQTVDFYEIDPTVIRMAQNPRYFTFLSSCPANLRIIEGDARLSLQNAPAHGYGVIVLDAFSSDAIPIHLLTREAIEMYLSKLAPDGIMAFHISNHYLDLRPVLANACAGLGLVCISQEGAFDFSGNEPLPAPSVWLLIARSNRAFGRLTENRSWVVPTTDPSQPVWTDDRSSVLAALLAGYEE